MKRQLPPLDPEQRCHDPEVAKIAFGVGEGLPTPPPMPAYTVGDVLTETETAVLRKVAALIHEIDPNIPTDAVKPERTLWEIGYDSLALVGLRIGVKRVFGPQVQALYWLRLHGELPRIGCFVRFLVASGAKG